MTKKMRLLLNNNKRKHSKNKLKIITKKKLSNN